jgi:hypothetical protein
VSTVKQILDVDYAIKYPLAAEMTYVNITTLPGLAYALDTRSAFLSYAPCYDCFRNYEENKAIFESIDYP